MTDKPAPPLFTLVPSDNRPEIAFRSYEDLQAWIAEQRVVLDPVFAAIKGTGDRFIQTYGERMEQFWAELSNMAASARAEADAGRKANASDQVNRINGNFINYGPRLVPLADDPRIRAFRDRTSAGVDLGLSARLLVLDIGLAFTIGGALPWNGNHQTTTDLDGWLQALHERHGVDWKRSVKAERDALTDLRKEATERQVAQSAKFEAVIADARTALAGMEADRAERARSYDTWSRDMESRDKDRIGAFETAVADLLDRYERQLLLRSASSYQKNRAEVSARSERGFFWSVLGLAAIGFGAMLFLLLHEQALFVRDGKFEVGLVALWTLPGVVYFVVMRLLIRLHGRHAAARDDAEFRRTLVTTFLALANKRTVEITAEERLLILQALFRPMTPVAEAENSASASLVDTLAKQISSKG